MFTMVALCDCCNASFIQEIRVAHVQEMVQEGFTEAQAISQLRESAVCDICSTGDSYSPEDIREYLYHQYCLSSSTNQEKSGMH